MDWIRDTTEAFVERQSATALRNYSKADRHASTASTIAIGTTLSA
jgi:hypothetical protein